MIDYLLVKILFKDLGGGSQSDTALFFKCRKSSTIKNCFVKEL